MDMTELKRAPEAAAPLSSEDTSAAEPDHWRDVVGEMSAEIAGPLTAALERVQTLATTGRIDRLSLRMLGEEIQRARQISMSGQQIARLASGTLRQTHERLALTDTLKDVLNQRQRETQARGIHIKQVLRPAEVVVDASLLFSLLNTLLSWAMEHACSTIDFRIDIKTWPAHARLATRFACSPADQQSPADERELQGRLDSMTWRLLEQTAWTMGLPIERKLEGHDLHLTVEFPRTVTDQLEGMSTIELDQGFSPTLQGKPLVGSQVLVVASRRDVRVQIRDAIRNMGLIVDFVNSVEEAREFCRGGLPHAIVIESVLRGDRFNDLRNEVAAEGADVVFIEIIEEGNTFEISGFGGLSMARVGRDAILTSLPSALMFELAKTV
jgi:CheY-like chemotaxis protein